MSAVTPLPSQTAGENILQLARPHVGEPYFLGALAPKDNSNWKGPWDCAEFTSWLVFQAAGFLYGCDNDSGNPARADAFSGFWQRDAESRGQIVSIDQAARTPGAFVLRKPQPGAIGHIVVSDGNGGTVEAHSHKDGVIASTLAGRRWDLGIFVPGIQYTSGPSVVVSPPPTIIFRLTTPPMTGAKVREIQQQLAAAGFDPGRIDGAFGPHTHAAVVAFQLSNGLAGDGEVGPQTARALGVQL
jgi:N-acetylmuramoyl-L-alanine amidase